MAKTTESYSDFDLARARTDNEAYTPGDQTGYRVMVIDLEDPYGEGLSPSYVVVHEATGMGIGTFPTVERMDRAIQRHQESIAGIPEDQLPRTSGPDAPDYSMPEDAGHPEFDDTPLVPEGDVAEPAPAE